MAKANDVLDILLDQMMALEKKMGEFSGHQVSMVENYDILIQNQMKVSENNDLVLNNQNTIIKNLGIVIHNQNAIIHNQSKIVKNQAYLKTFLHAQVEILSHLTNKPKADIANEINSYLENAQIEISQGFENPAGE